MFLLHMFCSVIKVICISTRVLEVSYQIKFNMVFLMTDCFDLTRSLYRWQITSVAQPTSTPQADYLALSRMFEEDLVSKKKKITGDSWVCMQCNHNRHRQTCPYTHKHAGPCARTHTRPHQHAQSHTFRKPVLSGNWHACTWMGFSSRNTMHLGDLWPRGEHHLWFRSRTCYLVLGNSNQLELTTVRNKDNNSFHCDTSISVAHLIIPQL